MFDRQNEIEPMIPANRVGISASRGGLLPPSSKTASGMPAASPRARLHHDGVAAPPDSLRTTSGTRATRRSPEAISLGTPMLTGPGPVSDDPA